MDNSKTKKRSFKALPPPIPPPETPRVRARLQPPAAPPTDVYFEDPVSEETWRSTVSELSTMVQQWAEEHVDAVEAPGANTETQALDMAESDEERRRIWERVVALAIEAMREPERRDWLREERMEEERERAGHARVGNESWVDWSGRSSEYIE
ncbi:hypothetical protein B0H12DRAFT_1240688 [Mycena haematopus]|nr:hypothetical protein B0H12DRAFT_1242870 [Mycena haematopus]KAJ7225253.1 hypothetical protein B0H12DRAFT_1240688 [Mycena haematopus]